MNYVYTSVNTIPNSQYQNTIDEKNNLNNDYNFQMINNRVQSGNTKLFRKKIYK